MPDPAITVDVPALLIALLFLGIFVSSLVLWARTILKRPNPLQVHAETVPRWTIGWVNFGLFICFLVCITFAAQQIGLIFIDPPAEDSEIRLTPWLAVAAICLLQLPMLLAFQVSRQLWPHVFGGPLNGRSMRPGEAARIALLSFLRYVPLVWIVSLAWSVLLAQLQQAEVVEEVEPQELIVLFSQGGDPLAIGLMALFAVLLAPVVEELIFRGCIYRFLKAVIPVFAAQLVSATLFAISHANLAAFLPLLFLGVILARSYERSGNVLVPILFHSFFNGFMLLTLFLSSQSSMPELQATP